MPKISDYIGRETVKIKTESRSKKKVIEELIDLFVATKDIGRKKSCESDISLLKIEDMGSTRIGQCISLRNGNLKGIKRTRLAFTNTPEGIEFNSLDGNPVYIVFLLIGPDKAGHEYIKTLSMLAQYLNDPYFRRDLVNASTKKEVIEIIKKREE